ncbi:MAG: RNA-binding protein [Haloarculaceae archaeon]
MASLPLHYVDLRAFCYATEDDQRVETALRTFLPEDVEIERARSTGHHGDRILVLSARVERADEMRHVLEVLADCDGIGTVVDELDERVDDNCAFYLTLDKQAAYRGEPRLGDGITFRSKVEAYPAKHEKAVANARELFESLG